MWKERRNTGRGEQARPAQPIPKETAKASMANPTAIKKEAAKLMRDYALSRSGGEVWG
jgi:hypothetical protein